MLDLVFRICRTNITGHLSLADVQAKDVESLVLERAGLGSAMQFSFKHLTRLTDFRIVLHADLVSVSICCGESKKNLVDDVKSHYVMTKVVFNKRETVKIPSKVNDYVSQHLCHISV